MFATKSFLSKSHRQTHHFQLVKVPDAAVSGFGYITRYFRLPNTL